MSIVEGVKVLGLTRQAMNNLVTGKAAISTAMAVCPEKALGGGAETCLRMQAAYDLALVEKRAGKIKVQCVRATLAPA